MELVRKKEMLVSSSIEQVETIISDVGDLLSIKSDFAAFILISIGIEALGNLLHIGSHDLRGESEKRFKAPLKLLFKNNWYKQNQQFMFENFRGSLIHQYRPGNGILLTSCVKNGIDCSLHLTKHNGRIIFVVEQLLEDFMGAVKTFKNNSNLSDRSNGKQFESVQLIEFIEEKSTGSASGRVTFT